MVEQIAIFAVDPGTISGVARGIFPAESDSVWGGLTKGKWEAWEVTGLPARQAWEIMEEYAEWSGAPTFKTFRRKGIRQHVFVVEDFVMRLGEGASSKREALDPVRVANGLETLAITKNGLVWQRIIYQQPSQAKTFASNDRLRRHGLWVKGSDHCRDAVRHMASAYAKVVQSV